MFKVLRTFMLDYCRHRDRWVTKAELHRAVDTLLPPEFFVRWYEQKPRRPESITSFRSSVVGTVVRDLTRTRKLERDWVDAPNKPGRWKVRFVAKKALALPWSKTSVIGTVVHEFA